MSQPLGDRVLPPTIPPFLPAALAVSEVGVWEYKSSTGLTYGDTTFARLYGLKPAEALAGVSTDKIMTCLHPDDRLIGAERRREMRERGGTFVFEYRTVPSPGEIRRVFVRGRYELNARGGYQGGRGIIIDITEGDPDNPDNWPSSFMSDTQFTCETALEKAARHAIAARLAINDVEHENRGRLLPPVNALLTELGRLLVRVASRETKRQ